MIEVPPAPTGIPPKFRGDYPSLTTKRRLSQLRLWFGPNSQLL